MRPLRLHALNATITASTAGTHFLLLELHQAEMVSTVKYSYTSSHNCSLLRPTLFQSLQLSVLLRNPFLELLPLAIRGCWHGYDQRNWDYGPSP